MYERAQAKANIDAMVAHLDSGIATIQARQVELAAAKHLLFEQREHYAALGRTMAGEPQPGDGREKQALIAATHPGGEVTVTVERSADRWMANIRASEDASL